ncbi:MAG: hypothetical protein HPPSJP_4700 [Candidatus Hepatoplasma scabrum]|nr:MAG: hypothetical protein HPPSJP_4700 [Candidatus Hepatoplasma sp.]
MESEISKSTDNQKYLIPIDNENELKEDEDEAFKKMFIFLNANYKNLYKENLKLIEFFKKNIKCSILDEFNSNTIINYSNWVSYKELSEIICSIKKANIDINDLIIVFDKFAKFIDYYSKKNSPKYFDINRTTEIINLIKNFSIINDQISSNLYKYINYYEKKISHLILEKSIKDNINISELKLRENKKKEKQKDFDKTINLIIKDKKISKKDNFEKNLVIIKNLSFYYKNEILKSMWYHKLITLDELINCEFIAKSKKEQLEINFKKTKQNLKEENHIFNFIFAKLESTRKYRNKISHLENLIISKKSANNLYDYLEKQEDLMRNGVSKSILFKIKSIFLENEFIRNNQFTKKYYQKFLE